MAIVYGLTDQGFVNKSLPVIRNDLNAAMQSAFGVSIDLSDRSVLGILIGIFAERLSLLWELLETITASQDPTKATGSMLDALSALTGTLRPVAAPSTVTLTLTGSNTTIIAAGSLVATLSTGKLFKTLTAATLSLATPWAPSTVYLLDAQVSHAGNVYQNIQGGTSAGSGGPTGVAPGLDGSCIWTYLGTGLAVATADASSVDDGPIVGAARDISVIVTPIGGWSSVTNLSNALLGRLEATDEELRVLRDFELSNAGNCIFDAIRAALLLVPGVTSVVLFPNNTDTTDADGVPPHSIESMIQGGEDQDIYNTLLASVAAGIGTYSAPGAGNHVGFAVDSQGTAQVERFSRPVEVPIYVTVHVTCDLSIYPEDGDQQVENAIIAYGAIQPAGRDAVALAIASQAFSVTGVLDVPTILLYTEPISILGTWQVSTAYVATPNARSVVVNNGLFYICTTSGTSAASGAGPSGNLTTVLDGTVVWRFLGNNITITSRQLATYTFANVDVLSDGGDP